MIDGYSRKNGQLYCENLPVAELAGRYETPLYIYSRNHYLQQVKKLQEALAGLDSLVCFAVKACSNLSILKDLAEAGCGFDIISAGELKRVQKAGGDPEKVVYAGVGKTKAEQKMALRAGIRLFNVESRAELEQLNRLAGELGKVARIAFRINPDIDAPTHEKITTGKKETKFGIPGGRLKEYADQAAGLENIELTGLHFHIGSQITSPAPFGRLAEKARESVRFLRLEGHRISSLNLGGGLGITYREEPGLEPVRWAEAVLPEIEDLGVKIIIEPGRFIVGNAGLLVTKVLHLKEVEARNFIVIDSGMNTLLRPALYDAYHEIKPVISRNENKIQADVVGPVCETGDIIGSKRLIERPAEGDRLAIFGAGAYGFSMASNYNSYPRPAEVLVDGAEETLIRTREDYEDLWRHERF